MTFKWLSRQINHINSQLAPPRTPLRTSPPQLATLFTSPARSTRNLLHSYFWSYFFPYQCGKDKSARMPFMKGRAPIRRTLQYLQSSNLVLKERVKVGMCVFGGLVRSLSLSLSLSLCVCRSHNSLYKYGTSPPFHYTYT
ncbi:putative 28S ribosomal protein S25, mitochondrial [Portunus trituberculatus]|uniref:Putative 28S ribosomal protein S25, mitochondrial n=1 Tax=Portunus trituberculatus TaxID=210409 RepID=A0A5B7ITD3_PORTR|nr:putative 28S ribosomal protein S25, mitochondrial [Portunus trituberculatus]